MTVPPHELRAHLLTALGRSQAASSDFDLNPVSRGQRAAPLRDAAVLIGVYSSVDGPYVLLTRRAAHLKHHPNQVAFPGGKVETKDALSSRNSEVIQICSKARSFLPSAEPV